MNYINYITSHIILDVENFAKIYDNYEYCTWLFIWPLWLIWILIKYTLLTFPIWMTINRSFGRFTFNLLKYIPTKK